jgi:Trypsin-like peptidase domain
MIRCLLLIALMATTALPALTQDIQEIKSGIVRIVNPGLKAQGTGFVVSITHDQSRIYIVTAAHVVKDAEYCDVYLPSDRTVAVKGKVTEPEEGETKGLALLEVVGDKQQFSDLTALEIGEALGLKGSESVQVFGFPEGTTICTVTTGNIARNEGRSLVVSGNIREGNSGGPVVFNGRVVGLVTDIRSFAYAEQGESIRQYVRGLGIALPAKPAASSPERKATPNPTPVPSDEFCQAVTNVVLAGVQGFIDIVGEPGHSDGQYRATISVPEAKQVGFVIPRDEVYYLMAVSKLRSEVESAYYKLISKLRRCLKAWEQSETTDSGYRTYYLKSSDKMPIVEAQYNLNTSSSAPGYRLWLQVKVAKK